MHSQAEDRLKKKIGASPPETDIHRLYHELQVHQVELEMQNDELRKAQAKLEESRSRHEYLYDFSPVGYLTFDRKGCIEAINLTGAALLGLERERLLKAPFSRFIQPDSLNLFQSHIEQVFTTGTRHICELWLNVKDRRLYVAMESIAPACDDGDPVQCHSAVMDFTERRRAERYQHLAAEILRILNNPSPFDDSIGLILAAIQRETGIDAVGIRLRSGDDFPYFVQNGFSQDFLLAENALIARDASGGPCRDEKGNISLECTCGLVISGLADLTNPLFTKGGSFWTNNSLSLLDLPPERDPRFRPRNTCIHREFLSMALIPIHANREIVGLLQLNDRRRDRFTPEMIHLLEGIAESIGVALMRKQTEKILEERTVQMENANKEMESFSYSVSHDLRAPLRAINGYSRMILKRQGERFDDETRRQFNLIRDNTRTMGQLIDDILAFSRLGRQAIAASRIDMESLAGEIWSELQTINPDREMALKIDRPPLGMGDRALIKQVLSNLLSNAVKFTRGRAAAVIEIGGHVQENENMYYVRDNGTGFDMQYYDKLFGVFQRLHNANEFEGTGVGLAIVQRIIHRHGGRVWAEGELDRGATFYFTLPGRPE